MMRASRAALVGVIAALLGTSVPVLAQSNNDDSTPLGSRIRRDKQFPLDIADRFRPEQRSKVMRERSKAMLGQFAQCVYKRTGPGSIELLNKTDFGFSSFQQINLDNDRAMRVYGFSDCLRRVGEANASGGVQLTFSPGSLRAWILEEAYFDRFKDKPTWITPGDVIGPRSFPLSQSQGSVTSVMAFADCVVQADPYAADYFYRVPLGSPEGKAALNELMPALGPCLPQGVKIQLAPAQLRMWLGEGLWHAANAHGPAGSFDSPGSSDSKVSQ